MLPIFLGPGDHPKAPPPPGRSHRGDTSLPHPRCIDRYVHIRFLATRVHSYDSEYTRGRGKHRPYTPTHTHTHRGRHGLATFPWWDTVAIYDAGDCKRYGVETIYTFRCTGRRTVQLLVYPVRTTTHTHTYIYIYIYIHIFISVSVVYVYIYIYIHIPIYIYMCIHTHTYTHFFL
jgi:hypothetical protein